MRFIESYKGILNSQIIYTFYTGEEMLYFKKLRMLYLQYMNNIYSREYIYLYGDTGSS